jgi:hypothetical protein
MKAIVIFLFSILWLNISLAQVKVLEAIDVDSVTSDFPVNFSFLQQGDWQFIGYYNKDRYLTVASRQVFEKKWAYKILPSKVGWDNHNYIRMALDRANCLHISGNMHADTLVYFKTNEPFKIETFHKVFPQVTLNDELRCTYPNFVKDADNRLIFAYRKGGSGNGNTINNVYDETTKTFKRLTDAPLFDGLNEMSAYMIGPRMGSDGYFHLTWVWRDTPDCETNHDLSYAKSKDLINWETVSGQKVELPITPRKNQFVVDAIPVKGGAINGGSRLFFDKNKTPMVTYHKFGQAGKTQMYIAKYVENQWIIKQISNWDYRWEFTGPGSITSEIVIQDATFTKEENIKISYWHIKKGYGDLIVDKNSLTLIKDVATASPNTLMYPKELLEPNSGLQEVAVKWMNVEPKGNANEFYGVRWETMGIRRYYEKREKPIPPVMMRLYKFSRAQ